MKVRVSMSNMPGEPIVETLEAESSLEAARAVLNSDEMSQLWECRLNRGAGWLIISAMPAREDANTGAQQRVPAGDKEALKLS